LREDAPYHVHPSRRSGEIGIRTRLKIWRTSLFMSVRVRPPAPPSSLFESLLARCIPLCRHVDNQLELVSNFPVNKDLINNGHAQDTFFLQAHITHGHRSLSVYLNGRVFSIDSVAVLCRLPIRFGKSVTRSISDKVIERALKGRSKVVRKLCHRWAEEYPSSLTKVIVGVKEIYGGKTIFIAFRVVLVFPAYTEQPIAPLLLSTLHLFREDRTFLPFNKTWIIRSRIITWVVNRVIG